MMIGRSIPRPASACAKAVRVRKEGAVAKLASTTPPDFKK
jgi:hypothetical protein